MNDTPEFSADGAPIYRHQAPVSPGEWVTGDSENIALISAHIETHIGPVETVFHELISTSVHIDVHIVAPTEDRPFYTLVTSGMSDRPMTVPEGAENLRYAELVLCLPADWPMGDEAWKDENNYWPIRALKTLARFPHEYQTWLCVDHTVPNGNPPQVYAPNCPYACALIGPVMSVSLDFAQLVVNPEKAIHFFGVHFIYQDELQFKLEAGVEPLLEAFDAVDHTELVDITRECVVE